jgi:16S rRNA (uracil1498-N3)-methyltransferase
MPGFLADPADIGDGRLCLRGDEAHHLAKVRRYKAGDEIEVADGQGMFYRVRLIRLEPKEALGEIIESRRGHGESPITLNLAPALIKGQRFDFIIEKATEIGVAAIFPLITERGIVRPGSEHKPDRWGRLARAATKQCGRSRIPHLAAPDGVAATVAALSQDGLVLLAIPNAPKHALNEAMTATSRTRVGLLIGPEGGFSTVEQNAAQAAGAVLFGWGERVLRADTASIVLTALVLYEAERQWL